MKANEIRVLCVSRNKQLANRIKRLFGDKRIRVSQETDLSKLLGHFGSRVYHIVLLSSAICKDRDEVLATLSQLTTKSPTTQILFLAEPADIGLAMSALKRGTYQYAKMPVSDSELRLLIETALEMRPRLSGAAAEEGQPLEERFEELIGRSQPMQQVYGQIRQAAATEIPVLILGETGTGKDLAAQAIHQCSARRKGHYIPVNLGALPSELVASELFGHEKGSFTSAMKQHQGKFEQADDGTVFLDEIDAIDEKVQISLLRLIEQKKFHRLGGRRAIKSNARLIAASNENLEEQVRLGSFREDLFYRLDVFRIVMPSLKERKGDIPLLITEFLARYNLSFNKNILRIAPSAMQLLESYDWPGNVRELKNLIQRAVLVCDSDTIQPRDLTARFQSKKPEQPRVEFEVGTPLVEVEREMIVRALSVAGNNRKRAAELLGISRRAIYNKLRKHNIE